MLTKSEKILKKVSISMSNEQIAEQYQKLKSVVEHYEGKIQGCSCIQYGQPLRGFVMRHPKTKEFSYVFNPTVLWKFGSKLSLEGCLSVTGRYYVRRPIIVKAKWVDESGKEICKILGYKRARIFMHEMDHLDGITIKTKGFGGIVC